MSKHTALALALLLSAPLAAASDALDPDYDEETCRAWPAAIPLMDGDTAWQHFVHAPCATHEYALAGRLEALLREGSWPDVRDDAGYVDVFRSRVNDALLRHALAQRDVELARTRLAQARAIEARADEFGNRMDAARADPAESGGDALAAMAEQQRDVARSRWDAIEAVLDGAKPPVHVAVPVPEKGWTLFFGWCGTPRVMFIDEARRPGVADAWRAVGRPEIALQALIAAQWTDALSVGTTPPRLRELAALAFGEERYEAEIDAALRSIRIEDGPDGRTATMMLFGVSVPLPIATQSWQEAEPRTIDVEEYMRARLLGTM